MARKFVSFLSAVLVFAWAPAASAQIWSAPGFTGIVDEADTSMHVFGSNGAVAIRSSARGTLNLRYPVQTLPDRLAGLCLPLRVNFRDTGAGARVIIEVVRLGISPGLPENSLLPLGGIDSDGAEPSGDPNRYRSGQICIDHQPDEEFLIDYALYAYFVDVQLIKTTATANPGLLSLQICPSRDRCDP